MPRSARVVIPGQPHHVTQRGNNRRPVFFETADRRRYLDILRFEAIQHGLLLHGYCLMSNHIHLVVTPKDETSLARGVGAMHLTYARCLHERLGRQGHLFQDRFYSCVLDRAHFLQALLYTERNPVRAGMVGTAWAYPWSSATVHTHTPPLNGILDTATWRTVFGGSPEEWRELLAREQRPEDVASLRQATQTGRVWADERVVAQWEKDLGRRLRPQPAGRPRATARKGQLPISPAYDAETSHCPEP